MSASIWNPAGTVVPTSNADNTLKHEVFNATAGQTVFTLTTFQYQPATQSLLVEINGVAQVLGLDYTETSNSSITLNSGAEINDQVVIRGYIGGTAAVAAQASAAAAAQSAIDATTNGAAQVALATAQRVLADADVLLTHADVALTHADVVAANGFASAAATQAGLAQNYAQLANITDYGAITGATTYTADYGSV